MSATTDSLEVELVETSLFNGVVVSTGSTTGGVVVSTGSTTGFGHRACRDDVVRTGALRLDRLDHREFLVVRFT
ncbi:hypothetical protein [Nocardioides sp. NPDC127503]|uniref:hypothetical protein n=1 Tax=Nocardioides sp. NPDC127503 TaxID=3154516 RepID=UPI00332D5BDD